MMRRRFGRGRRGKPAAEARNAPIDAGRWLPRIAELGVVSVAALEPVEADDIPASFAVLGEGATEEGKRVLLGFSPNDGADAALAVIAHARRLASDGGFDGEAIAVAPAWSVAARRRLAMLGEQAFGFRALAVSGLSENGGAVEIEAATESLVVSPDVLAARFEGEAERALFRRALAAFEGLAAKHGGAVRGVGSSVELVLLTRRVAAIHPEDGGLVLENLAPDRSRDVVDADSLAAAMDRLEGQLRKRLNDKRVRGGDDGLRAQALRPLAAAAHLRNVSLWPLGGGDGERIDLLGVDAQGRPVLGAVRERFTLEELASVLDAAATLRPSLALLLGDADPPLHLEALQLALAATEFEAATQHALAALSLGSTTYDVSPRRAGDPLVTLRDESSGTAPAARSVAGEPSRPRQRRRRGGRGGAGRGEGAPAAARDGDAGAAADSGARRFDEVSLFELDEESSAAGPGGESEDGNRSRRRGRGRGRRRRGGSGSAGGTGQETARDSGDSDVGDITPPDSPRGQSDSVAAEEDVVSDDEELSASLAPLEETVPEVEAYDDEDAFEGERDDGFDRIAKERDARRASRIDKTEAAVDEIEKPKAPRRRAAIVAHADRDSIAAAILLARDIRLVEGFWVYPQSELMTFFRSIATDLRADTPIYVVGFTATPARDTIQAASLYNGRLQWFGHHDWPPEDLESLRASIGEENVHVEPGAGSSVPAVVATRMRRSRFSDKLVELVTGRFTEHDYERWGRLWWHRLGEMVNRPGERRRDVDPLLTGRPSDLAKEAASAPLPDPPPEVTYLAERDFRIVHFGGYTLVVVPVTEGLDASLAARVARERFDATISLAFREGEELAVLGADDTRGRRSFDLGAMVSHLASKHDWIDALRDEDHVARMRVHGLASQPERLDEVVSEIAMGRSILEG